MAVSVFNSFYFSGTSTLVALFTSPLIIAIACKMHFLNCNVHVCTYILHIFLVAYDDGFQLTRITLQRRINSEVFTRNHEVCETFKPLAKLSKIDIDIKKMLLSI